MPEFGLFGLSEFPPEYDHLTLGNGRHLLLSGRDKKERKAKIGHGLWIRPRSYDFKDVRQEIQDICIEAWPNIFKLGNEFDPSPENLNINMVYVFLIFFAPVMWVGLRRRYDRHQAQDAIIGIGQHVESSNINYQILFENKPTKTSMDKGRAEDLAGQVLDLLQSASKPA
jgi:hypothetical protein